MARQLLSGPLVIASHNFGKIREIRDLIVPLGLSSISAADLNLVEPKETGKTFQDNAKLKACAAAITSGKPALADDSGLVVPALNGKPGIFSARWGGPKRDFSLAMEKVHLKLGKQQGFAWFTSCLSLAWPDGHCETFTGRVYGNLVWPPVGRLGFGYDPIFQPLGHKKTFGDMMPAIKNAMSHRALAFQALSNECFQNAD